MISIRSQNTAMFWDAANSLTETMTVQQQREFWNGMRHWLGVSGVLHTTGRANEVVIETQRFQLVDRLVRFEAQRDELQVHSQWQVGKQVKPGLAVMKERLRAIAATNGDPVPMIQNPHGLRAPVPVLERDEVFPSSRITLLASDADRCAFEVDVDGPSLLTRRVYQDGNWSAAFQTIGSDMWMETEVHQVDFLTQGIVLPAGTHRVQFYYQPWWLTGAILFALAGWIAIAASCILMARSHKTATPPIGM
jgi:hypothetical protein